MMVSEILTQERQNEEAEALAVFENPAALFPILPSSQQNQADEVVWIEGTITVSF